MHAKCVVAVPLTLQTDHHDMHYSTVLTQLGAYTSNNLHPKNRALQNHANGSSIHLHLCFDLRITRACDVG